MSAGQLEQAIGYFFIDPALLQTALTHRSYGVPHNERLEFIGDSVLNCTIALELYRRFSALSEGEMSRLRANLVCQDALHQIAERVSLGDFMRLGEGEMRSGGNRRPSILADAVEALIGAVQLDAGFDEAVKFVGRLYESRLAAIIPGQQVKDPKTRLQEHMQAKRKSLPRYIMLETSGEAHIQAFRVSCEIDSPRMTTEGFGATRRAAEQMAAERALSALEVQT